MTHFRKLYLLLLFVTTIQLSAQQKIKISSGSGGLGDFIKKDYSDTLYTYQDEHGLKMDHNAFWAKLGSETYALRVISEKGKQTIKQLEPRSHHKLIGTKVDFDSLNYSIIAKTAKDFKGKKVALMVFWGACSGCMMLTQDVKLIEKDYPDITFVHLAMNWKGLKAYGEKHQIGDIIILPETYDPDFVKFFCSSAPNTFFIDEHSEIKAIIAGARHDFIMKAFKDELQKL
jgi:hypothetical protein